MGWLEVRWKATFGSDQQNARGFARGEVRSKTRRFQAAKLAQIIGDISPIGLVISSGHIPLEIEQAP